MNKPPSVGGTLNSKEKSKPKYTALFVENIPALLGQFPPKHVVAHGHHSTITFAPKTLDGIEMGKKSSLKIIGRAYDEKGDALLVENLKSTNKHPHITLSCAEGVSALYSNELIEKAIASNSVEYFETPVEVATIEGYTDEQDTVFTSPE